MSHWQAIVLGVGGVGSAAFYELARRGVNVLGLDRFPPGHDRGSSHGQTRIIRRAYFEHPHYVPLAHRAFDRWRELEKQSGEQLLQDIGLLQVGPSEGHVLAGVRTSANEHGLGIEELSAREIESQFPGLRVPPGMLGLYELHAGILRVERCVQTHIAEAQKLGAELHADETIHSVSAKGDGVEVVTNRERYTSDMAIVTAGAWARELLSELKLPLTVRRKPSFWFAAQDSSYRIEAPCPAFLYETPEGVFYGIPQVDETGVKIAEHSGGRTVDDPLHVDRDLDCGDLERVEAFIAEYVPKLSRPYLKHAVCMYTMTPDEHFIVDQLPHHPHIALAAGLSGHGFKFAGVLGEAMVELLLNEKTDIPIDFLSLDRFE